MLGAAPTPRSWPACGRRSTRAALSVSRARLMLHSHRRGGLRPGTARTWRAPCRRCVHCGFCLPACPTYRVLGEEMDSPRGRILLMKNVLEGELALDEALPHIDRCLGCLACVTACPSGVAYGDLLTPFRMKAETERQRVAAWSGCAAALCSRRCRIRGRFRLAAATGKLARRMNARRAEAVPRDARSLAARSAAGAAAAGAAARRVGARRARVALLAGCAQQVLAPEIGWAAIRVLSRAGVEVVVPRGSGLLRRARHARRRRAPRPRSRAHQPHGVSRRRRRGRSRPRPAAAPACSEYELLFRGSADEAAAARLSHKVKSTSASSSIGSACPIRRRWPRR